MKARVIKTGKVIDVELHVDIKTEGPPKPAKHILKLYIDSEGNQYAGKDLDFINLYPDWQAIKIQAAIAAMQGFIANTSFYADTAGPGTTAEWAEKYAEALVTKLQEKI
jgi:hypothetical protein